MYAKASLKKLKSLLVKGKKKIPCNRSIELEGVSSFSTLRKVKRFFWGEIPHYYTKATING